MEKVHKNFIFTNEIACDEWVLEILVSHSIIIEAEHLVDIQLVLNDFSLRSCGLPESSKEESSIIIVNNRIIGPLRVLLHFLDLNILVSFAANHFFESQFVVLQIIHLNVGLLVVFLGDGDSSGRVERYGHSHDRVLGDNTGLLQQVGENVLVVSESHVWLNCSDVAHGIPVNDFASIFVALCWVCISIL